MHPPYEPHDDTWQFTALNLLQPLVVLSLSEGQPLPHALLYLVMYRVRDLVPEHWLQPPYELQPETWQLTGASLVQPVVLVSVLALGQLVCPPQPPSVAMRERVFVPEHWLQLDQPLQEPV